MAHILIRIFSFSVLLGAKAYATNWDFTLPDAVTGNFTAVESVNDLTISGTADQQTSSNFFTKLTVNSPGAGGLVSNGAVIYGINAPGFAFFGQPIITGGNFPERRLITAVATGSCPGSATDMNFTYSGWNRARHDATNTNLIGLGRFDWNPAAAGTAAITNRYNLVGPSLVGSSTITLTSDANCSDGEISFNGGVGGASGDRSGKMYVTTEGGAVYETSQGHRMFLLPRTANYHAFIGGFSGFAFNAARDSVITPLRMTFNVSSATGNPIINIGINSVDTDTTYSLTDITLNDPDTGFFTATLSVTNLTPEVVTCQLYYASRTVVFCAAQSPGTPHSLPYNLVLVSDARIQSGTLDTQTFNSPDGYMQVPVPRDVPEVALQSNGQILVSAPPETIFRLNTNGTLDTSFGTAGYVDTETTGEGGDPFPIKLQSTGKIVLGTGENGGLTARVLRYLTNGTLDTTFGTAGSTALSGPSEAFALRALAIDEGDRLLVAGGAFLPGLSGIETSVARLTAAGTLDTSYGTDGYATYGVSTLPSTFDLPFAMAYGANRAFVAGMANFSGDFSPGNTGSGALVAFNSSGEADTTFNTTGAATFEWYDGMTLFGSVALQPDGKPVACGTTINSAFDDGRIFVIRYNTDGTEDTTFGPGGGDYPHVDLLALCTSVVISNAGEIYATLGGTATIRVTPDGVIDTGFGQSILGTYIGTTPLDASYQANRLALQTDQKVVMVGLKTVDTITPDLDSLFVLRLWP